MIEFRTFGTIDLRAASDGRRLEALLAQPKRIALFTYLAVASPRGFHRRDTLLGIFWPEAHGDRARATLNQTVYLLRRVVGDDVILARGDDELGVSAADVRCDAVAFMDAIEAGRREEALDLYAGEFLNGFHLTAAPDFERWAEDTRAHFKRVAARAARDLAEREVSGGDFAGAAHWLRRAVAIEPYDETIVFQLVRVLAELGDRPGALREFDAFVTRLSRDLDLAPSEEINSFVDGLRANGTKPARAGDFASGSVEPHTQGAVAAAALSNGTTPLPPDAPLLPEVPVAAPRALGDTPSGAGAPHNESVIGERAERPRTPNVAQSNAGSTRGPRRAPVRGIAVALVLLVAGATTLSPVREGLRSALGGRDAPGLEPNRVIVVPFENRTGDSAVTILGRVAADWITQGLQRTGLVEVIDPVTAHRLVAEVDSLAGSGLDPSRLRKVAAAARVGIVVSGAVSRKEGQLEFLLRVTDGGDGAVRRTLEPVMADSVDIAQALEVMRTRVAGAIATVLDARVASIVAPSSPPPTFEAYQEYVRGLDDFTVARWAPALRRFERAVALDSSFVVARFWILEAMLRGGRQSGIDSVLRAPAPLRGRLPPLERAGVDMFIARSAGDWEAALYAARRAAQLAPQSPWPIHAATFAMWLDRPREALNDLSQVDPEMRWVNSAVGYWFARMNSLHRLAEYQEELSVARRGDSSGALSNQFGHTTELRALAALGRIEELRRRIEDLTSEYLAQDRQGAIAFIVYAAALELRAHGFGEDARALFEHCLVLYASAHGEPRTRTAEASCMYELGRVADASAHLGDASTIHHPIVTPGVIAAARGRREEAERIMKSMPEEGRYFLKESSAFLNFEQARIRSLLGDRGRAVELLQTASPRGRLWPALHTSSDFESIKDDPFVAALLQPGRATPNQRRPLR